MATFERYQRNSSNNKFTEPCLNCLASVTYEEKEAQPNPEVTGGKCITCPSCGKLMNVHLQNITLC